MASAAARVARLLLNLLFAGVSAAVRLALEPERKPAILRENQSRTRNQTFLTSLLSVLRIKKNNLQK